MRCGLASTCAAIVERQARIVVREHFELRREPLDTRLETPQRILRQQAADETELVAVAVEARVEEFRCDAPDEERVNRAILAPREVSRCEFAQALRLAELRDPELLEPQHQIDELGVADLECRNDLLEFPVVDDEISHQQQLRIGDEHPFLLIAQPGDEASLLRLLQKIFERDLQHFADAVEPLQREGAATEIALDRGLADTESPRKLAVGDILSPQAGFQVAHQGFRIGHASLLGYHQTIPTSPPGVTSSASLATRTRPVRAFVPRQPAAR